MTIFDSADAGDELPAPLQPSERSKRQRIGVLLTAYGVAETTLLAWMAVMARQASDGTAPWLVPVVPLLAILLAGMLTAASAQPASVRPEAMAVLDEVRRTYQNMPAYHFERVLLAQEASKDGSLQTIAELTLASATDGARSRAGEPLPPMNGNRFRLETRTRHTEQLQVCGGETCWSYSSLKNEYMVGRTLREVSTSVGGSMLHLFHAFPFLMLQSDVMQDVRVAREEEIVVGSDRRTCRVIEGVIRPRSIPPVRDTPPQPPAPGMEFLLSMLVMQGLTEGDARTRYWPWPIDEPSTEPGEPTLITLWIDKTAGVIVRSQFSAQLYKLVDDNGVAAVEKVSVVVTDRFTTATLGTPPADLFQFTRPSGAREVPNVQSRRRTKP
jgi:hypothetical protein